MALAALPEALADREYLDWYIREIHEGRERIMASLAAWGVRDVAFGGELRLDGYWREAQELVTAMRGHGVLLRDRSTDPGCDGYVRITVGVGEQVTRGLEALQASLEEIGWTRRRACTRKARRLRGARL